MRRIAITLFGLLQVLAVGCKAQDSQLVIDDQQCEANVSSNPDQALPHCTALIESGKLSPEDLPKAFILRGYAYRTKGDYNHAILDFDKAIQLKPDLANAFNNRGLAYDYKGDYDHAIKDFDQAIQLQPDYSDAFNNRGLVFGEKGNYDRAIQDFDEAIKLRPDYPEALDNRAGIFLIEGAYDQAIQDYSQAIKFEANNAGNFNDRAIAYDGKKDYRQALLDLDHALQLSPGAANILANRGVTNFYLGQFDAAEKDLVHSVQLGPTDPYSLLWLYIATVRNGRNSVEELRKNSAALKSTGWPQPLIQVYLRLIDADGVLASAKDKDSKKSAKQLCEAYFFLGENALLGGHQPEARGFFQKAITTRVMDSFEYMGAIADLDRMDGKSQR